MTHKFRVLAGMVVIVAGASSLTSCMSPTYGTDKTAAEQLLQDIGESVAIGSKAEEKHIAYQPRPGLVVPESERLALVEPQQSLADRESNPNWVESPEETRKRLLEEADGERVGSYKSPLAKQLNTNRQLGVEEQKKSYAERRKEKYGISDGGRRYLSDPPSSYRTVEDSSALADLGEPEKLKEKRREKEAKLAEKDGKKSQWWDPLNVF